MRALLFGFVLLVGAAGAARAADKAPDLLTRAQRLVPKGWTLRTSKLPEGVAAVVVGPAAGAARPVVAVRPWILPDLPATPEAAVALGARLMPGATLARVERGPLGWELETTEAQGLVTLHILHPQALITLTAPRARLTASARLVYKAAAELTSGP